MDSKRFQELVEESTYNHGSFADLYTCGLCDMKMWADNIHEHLQSHVSVCTNYQFNNENKTITPVFESPKKETAVAQKRKLPAPKTGIKQKVNVQSPGKTSLYVASHDDQRSDSEVESYLNSSVGHAERLSVILDQAEQGQTYFAAKPLTQTTTQSEQTTTQVQSVNKKKGKQSKKTKKDKDADSENVMERTVIQRTAVAQPPGYGPLNVGEIVTKIDLPYVVERTKLGTYHCSVVIEAFTASSFAERAVPLRTVEGRFLRHDDIAGVVENQLVTQMSSSDEESSEEDNEDKPEELLDAIESILTTPKSIGKTFGLQKKKKKKKKKKLKYNQVPPSLHKGRSRLKQSMTSCGWTEEPLAGYIQSELKKGLIHLSARFPSLETYFKGIVIIEEFDIYKWTFQELESNIMMQDVGIDVADPEELNMGAVMETVCVKQEFVSDIDMENTELYNHIENITSVLSQNEIKSENNGACSNHENTKVYTGILKNSLNAKHGVHRVKQIQPSTSKSNVQNRQKSVSKYNKLQNSSNVDKSKEDLISPNVSRSKVQPNLTNVSKLRSDIPGVTNPAGVSKCNGQPTSPSVSKSKEQPISPSVSKSKEQPTSSRVSKSKKPPNISKSDISATSADSIGQQSGNQNLDVSNINNGQPMLVNLGMSNVNTGPSLVFTPPQNQLGFVNMGATSVPMFNAYQPTYQSVNSAPVMYISKNPQVDQQQFGLTLNLQLPLVVKGDTGQIDFQDATVTSNENKDKDKCEDSVSKDKPENCVSKDEHEYNGSIDKPENKDNESVSKDKHKHKLSGSKDECKDKNNASANKGKPKGKDNVSTDKCDDKASRAVCKVVDANSDAATGSSPNPNKNNNEGTLDIDKSSKAAPNRKLIKCLLFKNKDELIKSDSLVGKTFKFVDKSGKVETHDISKDSTKKTKNCADNIDDKCKTSLDDTKQLICSETKQSNTEVVNETKMQTRRQSKEQKKIVIDSNKKLISLTKLNPKLQIEREKKCLFVKLIVKPDGTNEVIKVFKNTDSTTSEPADEDTGKNNSCSDQTMIEDKMKMDNDEQNVESSHSLHPGRVLKMQEKLVAGQISKKEKVNHDASATDSQKKKDGKNNGVPGDYEKDTERSVPTMDDEVQEMEDEILIVLNEHKKGDSANQKREAKKKTCTIDLKKKRQVEDQDVGATITLSDSEDNTNVEENRCHASLQAEKRQKTSTTTGPNQDLNSVSNTNSEAVTSTATSVPSSSTTSAQQPSSIFIPFNSPLFVQQPLTTLNQPMFAPCLQQSFGQVIYNQTLPQTIYPTIQQQTFIPQFQQIGTNTIQIPQQSVQIPIINSSQVVQSVSNAVLTAQSTITSKSTKNVPVILKKRKHKSTNVQPGVDKASTPSEKKESTPSSEKKAPTSSEKKESSPSSEKKAPTSSEKKESTPSSEKKAPTSSEKKACNPSSEKKASISSCENKAPTPNEKKASTLSEKKASTLSEKKAFTPSSEKKTSTSSSEKKESTYSEKKDSTPSSEMKASTHSSEKKASTPSEKNAHTSSEKKSSTPSSEKKASTCRENKESAYSELEDSTPTEKKATTSSSEKKASSSKKKECSENSDTEKKSEYLEEDDIMTKLDSWKKLAEDSIMSALVDPVSTDSDEETEQKLNVASMLDGTNNTIADTNHESKPDLLKQVKGEIADQVDNDAHATKISKVDQDNDKAIKIIESDSEDNTKVKDVCLTNIFKNSADKLDDHNNYPKDKSTLVALKCSSHTENEKVDSKTNMDKRVEMVTSDITQNAKKKQNMALNHEEADDRMDENDLCVIDNDNNEDIYMDDANEDPRNEVMENDVNYYSGSESDMETEVICDLCKAQFPSQDALKSHIKESHSYTALVDHYLEKFERFVCVGCGSSTVHRKNFQEHILKCALAKKIGFNHFNLRPYTQYATKNPYVFQCHRCNFNSKSKEVVEKHKETCKVKVSRVTFDCEMCGYKAFDKDNLGKHKLLRHSIKSFECHICNKSYPHSKSLSTHIQTKHSNAPPPPPKQRLEIFCDQCGIICKTWQSFHTHYRYQHLYDTECLYCKTVFLFGDQCMIHEAVHTGDFRFSCVVCRIQFSSMIKYYRHMSKMHSIEKEQAETMYKMLRKIRALIFRYYCEDCSESFLEESHFYLHMKRRHHLPATLANKRRLEALKTMRLSAYREKVDLGHLKEQRTQYPVGSYVKGFEKPKKIYPKKNGK